MVVFFLVFSIVCPSLPSSWAQTGRDAQEISERLDRLIKEVELIEEKQQQIFADQDKTIEKIKNLKIWTRK